MAPVTFQLGLRCQPSGTIDASPQTGKYRTTYPYVLITYRHENSSDAPVSEALASTSVQSWRMARTSAFVQHAPQLPIIHGSGEEVCLSRLGTMTADERSIPAAENWAGLCGTVW